MPPVSVGDRLQDFERRRRKASFPEHVAEPAVPRDPAGPAHSWDGGSVACSGRTGKRPGPREVGGAPAGSQVDRPPDLSDPERGGGSPRGVGRERGMSSTTHWPDGRHLRGCTTRWRLGPGNLRVGGRFQDPDRRRAGIHAERGKQRAHGWSHRIRDPMAGVLSRASRVTRRPAPAAQDAAQMA